MIFYFLFAFYYILCVKFLQNHQVMVTSLGLCCWPGRRIPQSSKCWSTCNIWGKMREGGEDDGKGMVSVIEGLQSLGGREMLSPMMDGIVLKYEKEINRLKQNDFLFFKKKIIWIDKLSLKVLLLYCFKVYLYMNKTRKNTWKKGREEKTEFSKNFAK